MPNFENMMKATHKGKILQIVEQTLGESLGSEDRIKSFLDSSWKNLPDDVRKLPKDEQLLYKKERLEKTGLTFHVEVIGEKTEKGEPLIFQQHESIPKTTGYKKSNLKSIIEHNNLPPDTEKWINAEIDLTVNDDGFWRIKV